MVSQLTCAELIIEAVIEDVQLWVDGMLVHSWNQDPNQ